MLDYISDLHTKIQKKIPLYTYFLKNKAMMKAY